MIKSMKNERLREIFLVRNGMDALSIHYPFMCKYQTQKLYPNPKIAKTFPSEIIKGRLYLGD